MKQWGNPEGIKVKIIPYINPWVEVYRTEEKIKQLTGKRDWPNGNPRRNKSRS